MIMRALLALPIIRVANVIIDLDGTAYPPCTDVPVSATTLLASGTHQVTALTESPL